MNKSMNISSVHQYISPYAGCFLPLFATISFFKATRTVSMVVSAFHCFSALRLSTLPWLFTLGNEIFVLNETSSGF